MSCPARASASACLRVVATGALGPGVSTVQPLASPGSGATITFVTAISVSLAALPRRRIVAPKAHGVSASEAFVPSDSRTTVGLPSGLASERQQAWADLLDATPAGWSVGSRATTTSAQGLALFRVEGTYLFAAELPYSWG